jgi:hypothetical protein
MPSSPPSLLLPHLPSFSRSTQFEATWPSRVVSVCSFSLWTLSVRSSVLLPPLKSSSAGPLSNSTHTSPARSETAEGRSGWCPTVRSARSVFLPPPPLAADRSPTLDDELEIEDFAWDDEKKVFHYPCPCGDRFEITRVCRGPSSVFGRRFSPSRLTQLPLFLLHTVAARQG